MKRKLLFVVNVDWFFISHRLPIAKEAVRQGYEVHIATTLTDRLADLQSHGLVVHSLPITRSGTRVWGEWRSFLQIVKIFRAVRPDIVHLVTVKPVLFGGIAARLTHVPAVVAAVSGLGFLFVAQGWRAAVARTMVLALYRLALGKRNLKVVFQNEDDRNLVQRAAALADDQCSMIAGSGVDLALFTGQPFAPGPVVVMLAARLLVDKGVREFVEAAQLLKRQGVEARFCLVGSPDPDNRASVAQQELRDWEALGFVEILGHHSDMPEVLGQAHVVVLPSYREGFPKVLIEAAACGRAVIASDVPGCRDAIVPNVTGLLVKARDAKALAEAMRRLIEDPALREAMGRAGRQLAERAYSIDTVVAAHMRLYRQLQGAA